MVAESDGQNSALNSMIKPYGLRKIIILGNGTILTIQMTPNCKLHKARFICTVINSILPNSLCSTNFPASTGCPPENATCLIDDCNLAVSPSRLFNDDSF